MNVTPEKRQELLDKLVVYEVAEAAKRNPQGAVDPTSMARPRVPPSTTFEGLDSSGVSAPSPSAPIRPSRQSTLEENWNPRLKEEVDKAVARFFFHDHVAFNAAR